MLWAGLAKVLKSLLLALSSSIERLLFHVLGQKVFQLFLTWQYGLVTTGKDLLVVFGQG